MSPEASSGGPADHTPLATHHAMPSVAWTEAEADAATEEDAFRVLYDTHFSFVWRCLRALGVPERQLDDAAQEVFLVAHRRLRDFRGDSSLRTWLYGILRNVAANQRRTLRRRRGHALLDERTPAPGPGPETLLQERERAAFVERFAADLDAPKRDVFVLGMVEQLSMPEVAEILGIPLNTAYTRLRTVRAEFRRAVARMRDEL
jgi:RNA polymerase sigma-70 factor (ECF subfamily)